MKKYFEVIGVTLFFACGYTVNTFVSDARTINNTPEYISNSIINTESSITNKIDTCIYSENIGRKTNNLYNISKEGLEHIKQYERFSTTPYKDNYGQSIGYGHLIKPGESYTKITKKDADKLFEQDIQWVNSAINRIFNDVKFEPTQSMVDAVGSIIYNCGEEGLKKSEFYKRLLNCRVKNGKANINDINYTAAAIKVCRIPSIESGCKEGVENRRMSEQKLFLN